MLDNITIQQFERATAGDILCLLPAWMLILPKFISMRIAKSVYDKLMLRYWNEVGCPPRYKAYIEGLKEYAEEVLAVMNGELDRKVNAKIAYNQAVKSLGEAGGVSIAHTCAMLSKYMGYPIRKNETSVWEFFILIQIYGQQEV